MSGIRSYHQRKRLLPPKVTDVDNKKLIENLEDRVHRLEHLLAIQSCGPTIESRNVSILPKQGVDTPANLGILNVKGSRSRFHGQNQKRALVR